MSTAYTTISANQIQNDWPEEYGASGTLGIFCTDNFTADDGKSFIAGAGDSLSGEFVTEAAITVAAGIATYASYSLPKTDTCTPNTIRYFAVIFDARGNRRDDYYSNRRLRTSLGNTINELAWANDNAQLPFRTQVDTKPNTDQMNVAIAAVLHAPSTTTQLGISKSSSTPTDTSNPVHIEDTDPRVAEFNSSLYTAESQTVPTPTTVPTVSTPITTLGTFGVVPGDTAFTDAHRYQVAITYNGRTGESTIGPAASFTATEGQGLAVAPNAPSTTLAASANIYIKDLDGDNTWRRAGDASGVVENNNCGFGDNDSAVGGMVVKYNVAGTTPPGVSTATKPDGSTALGETPTVAPTLTKLTSILSAVGTLYFSYSWVTENGETALSPISAGVTAPSGTIGAWMPLYVAEQPPPGACFIRIYAGTSATEAAMRLQAENPLQPRHPIHSFNSGGATHTTATPTTTICPSQLAYNAWLASGGPGHIDLSATETRSHPLIFGSFSGSHKFGCRITSHGTNNESSNASTGKLKSNYTGTQANATGVLICNTSLSVDNIEFGDPNSKVKYGLVIADFLGSQGHQNKYHNITVRALESGGIGILSKTNHSNSGGHASDTNVFTGKTSVFAESWATDFSGGQTVGHQIDNLAPVIANADAVANSGVIRQATTNIDYGVVVSSATGHYGIYITNEYLDPRATSNGQFTAKLFYSDGSDLRKYVYTSPLDINGSLFRVGSVYESNGSASQIYGALIDNPGRGSIDLLQMWGSNLYSFSNSVLGTMEFGLSPLQLTTPNWGSRTATGYATPMRVLCGGAYGLRNASGNLSTLATNAAGETVISPYYGTHLMVGTIRAAANSPAQITSNQNNYNPGDQSYFQRWNTDASRNVTGLTFTKAQLDGQRHRIVNAGSFNIVLKHQDANSTAANRFLMSSGGDATIGPDEMVEIVYDGTTARFRVDY